METTITLPRDQEAGEMAAWVESHRVVSPIVTRDEIVGLGAALAEIDAILGLLRAPELVAQAGMRMPRGLLLYGDPGTGKTFLARYVASELARTGDVPMFSVASDELDPDRLRALARHLDRYPRAVLYLDEIESWARPRSGPTKADPASERLLTAALAVLDGMTPAGGLLVIAASNVDPCRLEPALVRQGRLGHRIHTARPDATERATLLRRFVSDREVIGTPDWRRLATLTRGSSPAALRQIVDDALMRAIGRSSLAITEGDLIRAARRGQDIEDDLPDDPAVLRRVCVHEAGHAVVAALTLGPSWITAMHATVGGGHNILGDENLSTAHISESELDGLIATRYGGLAAERTLLGTATLGSRSDLAGAVALAEDAIEHGLDLLPVPVRSQVIVPHSAMLLNDAASLVVARCASARSRAERIIATHLPAVEILADRLARSGDLLGNDLREALEAAGLMEDPGRVPA